MGTSWTSVYWSLSICFTNYSKHKPMGHVIKITKYSAEISNFLWNRDSQLQWLYESKSYFMAQCYKYILYTLWCCKRDGHWTSFSPFMMSNQATESADQLAAFEMCNWLFHLYLDKSTWIAVDLLQQRKQNLKDCFWIKCQTAILWYCRQCIENYTFSIKAVLDFYHKNEHCYHTSKNFVWEINLSKYQL